jgi:hypothetical protein
MNGVHIKVVKTLLFIALILSISNLKSQTPLCNYHVQNSSDCTINVTVRFYDSFGICTTVNNPTLASNTPWFPSCSGTCGPIVDIEVELNTAGGCTPTGVGTVNITSSSDSGGFVAPCLCGTSSNYSMTWYYNLTIIQ